MFTMQFKVCRKQQCSITVICLFCKSGSEVKVGISQALTAWLASVSSCACTKRTPTHTWVGCRQEFTVQGDRAAGSLDDYQHRLCRANVRHWEMSCWLMGLLSLVCTSSHIRTTKLQWTSPINLERNEVICLSGDVWEGCDY